MSHDLRFGVWALEEGTFGSPNHPEDPHDASWARVGRQIALAEELGFDSTLVAQLTVSPFGEDYDQLEAWTTSAALAAVTERIEIITAVKPYLYHPVVLAKMALNIEEISGGRSAINLVNGWFVNEVTRAGIEFRDHDERYAYGREWITVVKRLIRGERTSFDGRYFHVDEYMLRPAPKTRERPLVYLGGESPAARDLVAAEGDVWFMNGQPLERISELIGDVRARPRSGAPVRFGLAAFVIARETEEEADAALAYAFELKRADAQAELHSHLQVDPKAVMHQTLAKHDFIGSNGGTAAGLVGSYEQVADRIRRFHEAGVELFMLQFQPFDSEMARFAHEVVPRVRRKLVAV